jgi:hypothetical protein
VAGDAVTDDLAAAMRFAADVHRVLPVDPEADRMVAALMPTPRPGRRLWSRAEHDPGDEDRS